MWWRVEPLQPITNSIAKKAPRGAFLISGNELFVGLFPCFDIDPKQFQILHAG